MTSLNRDCTIFIICLILLSPAFTLLAANDWENPHMIGRNKEPAHVSLIPDEHIQKAISARREASIFRRLCSRFIGLKS
ncbi:MAG: hypothetical protein ACE5HX_03145 [bacterium]